MERKIKKAFKPLFSLLVATNVFVFTLCGYLTLNLPSEIVDVAGADMTVMGVFPITAEQSRHEAEVGESAVDRQTVSATLKLFGVFPIKEASVTKSERSVVAVLGTPFGIKIYADGVMTVGISGVDTSDGNIYPARDAGIEVGDVIVSLNGEKVYTNSALAKIVEKSNGENIEILIKRDGKEKKISLHPAYSVSEKSFKIGLWVRDSSAGIGTLTFYDPETGIVAGLGHGITDSSTGSLVPLKSGEMVGAEILGIAKSSSGTPGELQGRFTASAVGEILLNSKNGIYGKGNTVFSSEKLYPVATKQEIKEGDATVITTLDGTTPKSYKISVERVYLGNKENGNMIIKITDSELLAKAGGIVQGMSGSPIIQNGKLIGAVTHVFIGDTARGYAVFAENMLTLANETNKKAS